MVGAIPLLVAQIFDTKTDPFDKGTSYLIWVGGLFFSALGIGIVQPYRAWRWGIAVGFGLPAAAALEIIIDLLLSRASHSLWPLTILVSLVIAAPSAFVGAYLGSKLAKRDHPDRG